MIQNLFKPGAYEKIELKREELLRSPGTKEQYIYFVQEGALRAIYYSENQLLTVRLAYQKNLINGLDSYLAKNEGLLHWQALKKTILWRINRSVVDDLLAENIEHLKAWTGILEQLLLNQMQREIDILIESPKLRYERVLKRSPQLFSRSSA